MRDVQEQCHPTKTRRGPRFIGWAWHCRGLYAALSAAVGLLVILYLGIVAQWPPLSLNPPPVQNAWVRAQIEHVKFVTPNPSEAQPKQVEEHQNIPTHFTTNDSYFNQSYEARWVQADGAFLDRIRAYNEALGELRSEILETRGSSEWKAVAARLRLLWCNRDDCLQEMGHYPEIQTLALQWYSTEHAWDSRSDKSNMILQTFYPWSVSELLCSYIQTPGRTKARWDAVYNRQCTSNVDATTEPSSLEPVYLHGKPINVRDYWPNDGEAYPSYFYSTLPPHVFHIHVIQDGVITGLGDVISGDLKLLLYACSQDTDPRPPTGHEKTPLYDEVFVVTQFWGAEYFHKMVEGFPRIAPYMEFLKSNPHIKIHVAETGGRTAQVLEFLGFNTSRLVTEICRAKVIYLPQATPCGFAHAQAIQLLSSIYHQRIRGTFGVMERRTVLLIERTGQRRLIEHRQVARALQELSVEFGLRFELFSDHPVPNFNETMQMFHRAVLVVAPHGAGLANIVFSQPGTYVIEALCHPPHVNMCFQWTAHALGHHYHGVMAEGGCLSVIHVVADDIIRAARRYLQLAADDNR